MNLALTATLAATVLLYTATDGPAEQTQTYTGLVFLPPVALNENCRPAAAADSALARRDYRRIDRLALFETWESPSGQLLTLGRLDGYVCVMWPESGWAL